MSSTQSPHPRLGSTPLRALLVAALAMLGTVSACAQTSLPDEFLGTWYYMGSSGGISGEGVGDEPTGYMVIKADNTIDSHRDDGELIGTSEFTVSRGETIFSVDEQWILNLGSDIAIAEVIQVSDDGQYMSLAENVYDGFQRSYARSR